MKRVVLLVVGSFLLGPADRAQGAIPGTERQALLDFYAATGGPRWTTRTGWLGGAGSECTWYGITCDAAGAHVRDIDLSSNNLSGPLPPSLAQLTALEGLTIFNSEVSGSLPDIVAWLPQARTIRLPGTKVTGPIPGSIGTMPRLATLLLNQTPIGGTLPESLGSVATLRILGLNGAGLTGRIPASITNLSALETLGLYANALTGPIPADIGRLTNLTSVGLARNQLSGPIPESIGNLVNLTSIDLSANDLTGSIPASLANLSQLQTLYLSQNTLSGPIPEGLGTLRSLKVLGLHRNGLTGSIPASLGSLPALEQLKLYGNALTGEVPVSLGGLTKLDTLWLGENPGLSAGPIPSWIRGLGALTSLDLGNMNLAGPIPEWLGELTSLAELGLDRNRLTGPIPDGLGQLKSLEYLFLADNSLDPGPVPAWIQGLAKLSWLGLGGCRRNGPFPAWLDTMPELTYLDLGRNAFSGPIPIDMDFPKLDYLYIQSNALSIPEDAPGPDTPGQKMKGHDIRWNAFGPRDPRLRAYLDFQQPGWEQTQTVAPSGVAARAVDSASFTVSWTPIPYTADAGGTRVLVATKAGGPYTLAGTTVSKSTSSLRVTGLAPATRYFVVVQTLTEPHANNTNPVESGFSGEVSATTAAAPCPAVPAPSFTSVPVAPVPAGSSFTLAWSPVVGSDPRGTYLLDLSALASCASPVRIALAQPSFTVPTEPGKDAVFCAVVRAVDAAGCTSPASAPVTVAVTPPPAAFAVIQPQAPPATAAQGEEVTATSTVVLQNLGGAAGAVAFAAVGGFFTVTPASIASVPAGSTAVATIAFTAAASQAAGVQAGALVAAWGSPSVGGSLVVPITLTVLSGPAPAGGSKLIPVGTNEVHLRATAGTNPDPVNVLVRNAGEYPARLTPSIGPAGGWLRISGDFATALLPGAERVFQLTVDRGKRTPDDGTPPLLTGLAIGNVDGAQEDAALFTVFDEEPVDVGPGTGRAALGEEEFSLVIGSSVSARGASDTLFLSDGWIRNRGGDPATMDLVYTPDGSDGLTGSGVLKARIRLEGHATFRLADFVNGVFGASGSGQMEIRSKSLPQLSVRATADALTEKDGALARYGAEVPVLVTGQGASARANAVIAGIRGPDARFRTNVILAETSGAAARVELALYDAAGALAGKVTRDVAAWSKIQVNAGETALFPSDRSFDGGTLEVKRLDGEGTVAAFATAIDDASGSYATRVGQLVATSTSTAAAPARPEATAPAVAYLPAAAHAAAANDSFYRTTLVVANATASSATLKLTYLPDGGGEAAGPKEIVLGPRAEGPKARVLEDVVASFFGVTSSTAGMIRFEGDVMKVLVASDTWTWLDGTDQSKGRSVSSVNPAPGSDLTQLGVFTAAAGEVVGARESGAERQVVSHPAIEEGRAFRTNLILAEVSGAPATVRVVLTPKASAGAVLAAKTITLGANERRQVNRVIRELLPGSAGTVEQREVEISVEAVSGEGRVLAIVTRIDNAPASKRADIFTLGGAVAGRGIGVGR